MFYYKYRVKENTTMPEIKKTLELQYEDNSYGKTEQKTKTFTGDDLSDLLSQIETFRYNGGYIIKNKDDLTGENIQYVVK